jgi:hypothetical protein
VRYFIVCGRVERVANSQDYSLTRVVHTLRAASLPGTLSEIWLFAQLSEGRGEVSFVVELWDCDSEPERRVGGPWRRKPVSLGQNPLAVHGLPFLVRNISFERPGRYEFRLFCGGERLAVAPVDVEVVS